MEGFQPRGSHLNEVPALPGITNEEAIAADVNYDENADRSDLYFMRLICSHKKFSDTHLCIREVGRDQSQTIIGMIHCVLGAAWNYDFILFWMDDKILIVYIYYKICFKISDHTNLILKEMISVAMKNPIPLDKLWEITDSLTAMDR